MAKSSRQCDLGPVVEPAAERDVRGMVQVGVEVRFGLELEDDDELEVRGADAS